MDRHPHPARYQSASQEYIPDAKIQNTIPLASLPGGGETQRYSDGRDGNYQSVHSAAVGEEVTNHHRQGSSKTTRLKPGSTDRRKQLGTERCSWTGRSNRDTQACPG